MGAEIAKVCGLGVVCAFSALVLKRTKSELSFAVAVGASVLLFLYALRALEPLTQEMLALFSLTGVSELLSPILKALGVAILTHISSGICGDCGETRIADSIELVGKLEILLLSLPLIKNIIGYAMELISLE